MAGLLTITGSAVVAGTTYDVSVASSAGVLVGDHLAAELVSPAGEDAIYRVLSIPNINTVRVEDDLLESHITPFGLPAAGQGAFGTPGPGGLDLSFLPEGSRGWRALNERNNAILNLHGSDHLAAGADPIVGIMDARAIADRIRETGGPTILDLGAVADTEFLTRSGTDVVGVLPAALPVNLHASTHENGGLDEIDVTGLSGLLADAQTALSHASTHEDGGGDEISVTGLSGLLADGQTPLAHAASHQSGGGDEVNVAGLSGQLADDQLPVQATEILKGGAELATQAETDAGTDDTRIVTPLKLATTTLPFTPAAHATSHENGGGDEINVAGLSGLLADGQTPLAHAASHQNGGSDELNVAGLSGQLADDQPPLQATEILVGGGEIATQVETDAGTDDLRIVTPLKLANYSGLVSSPLTTKGDLYTYDVGNQRLAVGTDLQLLVANSATATGLEWVNELTLDLLTLDVANGDVTLQRSAASPEGVVTASPGSLAMDVANGDLYVKGSGVGNTGWKIPGAGLTDLQGAYDNNPSGAQILLNATPDPITIQASVAGDVFSALDVSGNPILAVTADPDAVTISGGLTVDDAFLNAAAANSIVMSDTFTTGGGFNGGGILSNGTVTYDNSFFIWGLLVESKVYQAAAAPGFAAFTLFNALPVITNSGNFDLVQALVLNVGVNHRRTTSGTSTAISCIGMSFSPQLQTMVSGAVMTRTTTTALRCSPTWNTVAGSTVNLGTITAVDCFQPAVAIFGSSAGTENMTSYTGLHFPNMTFGGAVPVYRVVWSELTAGTNKRFLYHTGNAASTMRGSLFFDVDNVGTFYGASNDVVTYWNGTNNAYRIQFVANTTSMLMSNPASGRILVDNSIAVSAGSEFNFNCSRFSLGAQTGAVGNQVGVFVTPARTVTVGGEWSDFLLTQGGNITVDAAMGLVAGWTVNAPSVTLGTGSVTTAAGLNVGGNPTKATNRVGVRIISNPTGGGGVNAALWVTAGRSQFDGLVDLNQPIALGGGATATLGTIGGSGPTTAAQAQWVEIEVNGVSHWIPAWT